MTSDTRSSFSFFLQVKKDEIGINYCIAGIFQGYSDQGEIANFKPRKFLTDNPYHVDAVRVCVPAHVHLCVYDIWSVTLFQDRSSNNKTRKSS